MTRVVKLFTLLCLIQIHALRPFPSGHSPSQRVSHPENVVRKSVEVDRKPGLEVWRVEDVAAAAAGGEVVASTVTVADGNGKDVCGCGVGSGRDVRPGGAIPVCVLLASVESFSYKPRM